ncbi:MAG: rhomboid family intramembrane serine protease [Akkermansia sp.]
MSPCVGGSIRDSKCWTMGVNERSWMQKAGETMTARDRALVVHWLIALNGLVFLIGFFTNNHHQISWLDAYGAFGAFAVFDQGEWWRLITYQFLHANLGHIAFNMIGLWVFGPVVESAFGHWRFLLYYLVCGVAATLFYTLLGSFGLFNELWQMTPLIGASGSIYGVIAACAVLFPDARIQLIFPPINLSMRNFAIGVLIVSIVIISFNWHNAGGEAGHLGGMLMGFLIMVGIEIKRWLKSKSGHQPLRLHGSRGDKSPPNRPSAEEVDAILSKISKQGLDSLTMNERNVLKNASRVQPSDPPGYHR